VLILTKIAELQGFLRDARQRSATVGFVPTMGALHEGHVSLIAQSRQDCDVTVCSIFVNPRQFNDKDDLKRYPRTPEADAVMLRNAGCDALFMPEAAEIYPDDKPKQFDLGGLDRILEGRSRPGHFDGVAQVVNRFFELIKPDRAYFGSKDYQQLLIVRKLVKQQHFPIEVVAAPIIREKDGLAMSSRNALLSPEERKAASFIPMLMQKAKQKALESGVDEARKLVEGELKDIPHLRLDYFEICDASDLSPVTRLNSKPAISLIAVHCGKVRLIDNLQLN
jgi:pantoate--beta-alanine ligase